MELITVEAEVFKRMVKSIANIEEALAKMSSKKNQMKDDLVDSCEACQILKVSRKTLDRHRAKYGIPFIKINKRVYYKLSDLELFLEKQTHNSNSIL